MPAPAFAVRGDASSRSISFSYASGDRSATNASTSSGVGGRPIRSKVDAADQRPLVGRLRGRQSLRLQLRQDEAVNRVSCFVFRVSCFGDWRTFHGPERPVVPTACRLRLIG